MTKKKTYAIVDLETTGGHAERDRIIEVGIVHFDGTQVTDTYQTFVYPERVIPYNISQMTGISQEMVEDAPKFYEVAKEIIEKTEGRIFVAHNARFDYNFLKWEYERLGYTFTRRRLCTLNLSKRTFTDFRSHSLGNLTRSLGIKMDNHHRALDDALATTELLKKLFEANDAEKAIHTFVNAGIKISKLPASITLDHLHSLPESPGVYYMLDQSNKVVYVGKSNNIKKRIMQHFAQSTQKAELLQSWTHHIDYTATGNELIALLLENDEIKRLKPAVNKALRATKEPHFITSGLDSRGYLTFQIEKNVQDQSIRNVVAIAGSSKSAKSILLQLVVEFELCKKLCGISKRKGSCFEYHMEQCYGACVEQESTEAYNERVLEAIEQLPQEKLESCCILAPGRTIEENGFVLVDQGQVRGYGFVNKGEAIVTAEDFKDRMTVLPNHYESTYLVTNYLKSRKRVQVISLEED